MLIECVPMDKEVGDLAPIYFKKAILECETECATNKKLVDLKNKDVRRAVPNGLPFFTVGFGLDPGFAHDHSIWRKQRKDNFDAQRKKVMQFAECCKPYDFTVNNS
ncbi:hypothetical protein L9F63_026400 [Diploptera punctata]|uniref:Uncharacterized protein n=1 Tax=Diploptera punctata TaxID=6984 RepID=A0AAD8AII9_DIPPU|nr:hypothetical protein L9F63_026400 [Diploptera punctata]